MLHMSFHAEGRMVVRAGFGACVVVAIVLCGVCARSALATSVTRNYSHNWVSLHTDGQASFVGTTAADSGAMINDNATAARAGDEAHPPYDNDAESVVPFLLPTTGAPKDHAGGDYKVAFSFG